MRVKFNGEDITEKKKKKKSLNLQSPYFMIKMSTQMYQINLKVKSITLLNITR